MAEKVKSLADALKAKKQAQQDDAQVFAVEGESPERLPHVGQTVELTWADPTMIGSPKVTLGLIVARVSPESDDGRVTGYVVMDPAMQVAGPGGRPMQVPPLVPVGNVPYSRENKAMTWRFHGEGEAS